jgi:hypothetical protein
MDEQRRKFLADRMLGKLAKYLRMLGFDTFYFTDQEACPLIERAAKENRIILTRDTALRKIAPPSSSLFIAENLPFNQLLEVVRTFGITSGELQPFSRCLRCNQGLINKSPEAVASAVPHYVLELHQKFSVCPRCGRVYWEGSHKNRMERMVDRLFSSNRQGGPADG